MTMPRGHSDPVGIWLAGDPAEIRDYLELGIVGLVTNTIVLDGLVDKYGPILRVIEKYLELQDELPLVVEVDADTAEDLVAVSQPFLKLSPRVVMKIPCTLKGLRTVARLKQEGRACMVTTTFSVSQAVAAAAAGAAYVAPFVGPTMDSGADAREIVSDIVRVFAARNGSPYIAAGIVRTALAAHVAIRAGCDGIVIFPKTYEEMLQHPGTAEWNTTFRRHWDSMGAKGALEGLPGHAKPGVNGEAARPSPTQRKARV